MITLKLKEILNPGPTELRIYETPDGRQIAFQAGEKAFTWHISTLCPILHKHRERIIDQYISQGGSKYKIGHNESVTTLRIFI